MARARPHRPPVAFHTNPPTTAPVVMFPGAVSGEQYARYAKSVWAQAHQWLDAHWTDAAATATTALDVRQKLRAVAATDVKRHLHPLEEQLLSEIVHAAWNRAAGITADLAVDDDA
jgi:hypothetical protein